MPEPRAMTPREVARLLDGMAVEIDAEVQALPDDVASWHPAPLEWCVKECLGHLIEAERRGFNGRIKLILEQPGRGLDSWDQVQVQHLRGDCDKDVMAILAEFHELRDDSIRLVDGLREADLEQDGLHVKVGVLRIRDLLHEWVHHDRNHFKQIQANTQLFVWPSMANAQRFSGD